MTIGDLLLTKEIISSIMMHVLKDKGVLYSFEPLLLGIRVSLMNLSRQGYFGILLLLVLVCGTGCPPQLAFVPDDALESAMRAEIGKPLGFLTEADLLDVFSLDARGLNIRDLTGLGFCRNVEWIDLSDNQIADITEFNELNPGQPSDSLVFFLDLSDNDITDITPLASMLNLNGLDLSGNPIADIGALVTNAEAGGLGDGDYVVLDVDQQNNEAINIDIPTLEGYGVNVLDQQPAK